MFFLTTFLILLVGCNHRQSEQTPEKTPIVIKKEKKKIYKHCNKHRKIMTHALTYINEEFDKGYFLQKDLVGAKAQLFLIENKSPTPFAKNINSANDSYIKEYKMAGRFKCNLKGLHTKPLESIKIKIKKLESKQ